MKQALAFLALMFLTLLGSRARAQESDGGQPAVVPAQVPMYVAPLSQRSQPSYVPQSVALSGPPVIRDWNEARPVPFGYHTEERTRKGLVIGGAVTLGALWLLSALVATDGESGNGAMAVPIMGPFIQMAANHDSSGNSILLVDGLGQIAGAVMLVAGLSSTKTILVRNDLGEVRLSPIVTREGAAMGLVGRF